MILALFIATAAPAQDRQYAMPPLLDRLAEKFKAVGRVNKAGFNTKGSCSGTLIRPDVVLTAGHCARGRIREGTKRTFVAGYSRGAFVAVRDIVDQVTHPAYYIGGRHDPRFDIGLLFLESPITEVQPLPLAPDGKDRVALAGYHRFIPHLLSGRLDCKVLDRSIHLVRVDCPVVSGNSGGPMLEHDTATGWQVTGVVSSQERREGAVRAIAVRIPQWVHDVLAEREVSR